MSAVADDLLGRLATLRDEHGPAVDDYLIGALAHFAGHDVCVEGAFVRALGIAERAALRVVGTA